MQYLNIFPDSNHFLMDFMVTMQVSYLKMVFSFSDFLIYRFAELPLRINEQEITLNLCFWWIRVFSLAVSHGLWYSCFTFSEMILTNLFWILQTWKLIVMLKSLKFDEKVDLLSNVLAFFRIFVKLRFVLTVKQSYSLI